MIEYGSSKLVVILWRYEEGFYERHPCSNVVKKTINKFDGKKTTSLPVTLAGFWFSKIEKVVIKEISMALNDHWSGWVWWLIQRKCQGRLLPELPACRSSADADIARPDKTRWVAKTVKNVSLLNSNNLLLTWLLSALIKGFKLKICRKHWCQKIFPLSPGTR